MSRCLLSVVLILVLLRLIPLVATNIAYIVLLPTLATGISGNRVAAKIDILNRPQWVDNSSIKYLIGLQYLLEGHYETSAAVLAELVERDARLDVAGWYAGLAFERSGNHQRAVTMWRVAGAEMLWFNSAKWAASTHNWGRAVRDYTLALEIKPTLPGLRCRLASAMIQSTPSLQEAEELASEGLLQSPKDWLCHSVLVEVAVRKRNWATAIERVETAIARLPWSEEAKVMYVQVLVHSGRIDEALQVGEAAMKQFPNSSSLRYSLGRLKARLGDWQAALVLMQEAVALTPKSSSYRYYLATICTQIGDWECAALQYRAILAYYPEEIMARTLLDDLVRRQFVK